MDESGTPLAQSILALERGALDRWGKGDPGGCLALCAPEVTYFDPLQARRIDGLEQLTALYNLFRGKIHIERDEIIEPKVQPIGDSGAVLTYRFVSEGSEGAMRWNCTEVYQRFGEDWKIVHTHWSYTGPGMPGGDNA